MVSTAVAGTIGLQSGPHTPWDPQHEVVKQADPAGQSAVVEQKGTEAHGVAPCTQAPVPSVLVKQTQSPPPVHAGNEPQLLPAQLCGQVDSEQQSHASSCAASKGPPPNAATAA